MMCDQNLDKWKEIWNEVKEIYNDGYCVCERTMQAILYKELSEKFSESRVIAEPTWGIDNEKKEKPDIVIVDGKKITDIFELKFIPSYYPQLRDIEKLQSYQGEKPVKLILSTGKCADSLPIRDGCRLHFVSVARGGSSVNPELISNRIWLWYGHINKEDGRIHAWSVCKGKKELL